MKTLSKIVASKSEKFRENLINNFKISEDKVAFDAPPGFLYNVQVVVETLLWARLQWCFYGNSNLVTRLAGFVIATVGSTTDADFSLYEEKTNIHIY